MQNLFGDDVDPDAPERDLMQEDMDNAFHVYHSPTLFDWVHSIKTSKTDLRIAHSISKRGKGKDKQTVNVAPDPNLKTFDTYMVLQALQQSEIAAPFAYMINARPYLSKEQAYLFLLHAIPAHTSYDAWIKKKDTKLLDEITILFNIGKREAKEYFEIYSVKELTKLIKEYKESQEWQKLKKNKKLTVK